MKTQLLTVVIMFFTSCSSQKTSKLNFRYSYEELEHYINNENFEKAEKFYAETPELHSDWRGEKRLSVPKQCIPVMKNCDKKNLNKQEVLSCLYLMAENCNDRYLTNFLDKRENKIKNNLIEAKNEIKIAPKIKGICEDGTKWGYFKASSNKNSYNLFTNSKDFTKLIGEYENKTTCEEVRLLKNNSQSPASSCYPRYILPDKKIEVFTASFMDNTTKYKLYFHDELNCQRSVENGLNYFQESGVNWSSEIRKFNVSAKGTGLSSRFISNCKKEKIIVCKKNVHGEVFLKEIL